jgi:hypothetical protein
MAYRISFPRGGFRNSKSQLPDANIERLMLASLRKFAVRLLSEVRINGTDHVNDLDQSVAIPFEGQKMSLQDLKRLDGL